MHPDSAVTISSGNNQKIFTSANKIFALSKYCPIGIMFYGNAKFMEVPWETLIKVYRNNLGEYRFDTLKDHAYGFLNYLKNCNLFQEAEIDYIKGNIYGYFILITEHIREKVEQIFEEGKKPTDDDIKKLVSEEVEKHYGDWRTEDFTEEVPENFIENFKEKYGSTIEEIKDETFEELPISKKVHEQLIEIAIFTFIKKRFHSESSGVVITGFGKEEIFPSIIEFEVEGVFDNYLKYQLKGDSGANFNNTALIYPFAQKEMVKTFIEGIEPNFQQYILEELFDIMDEATFEEFTSNLDDYKFERFVSPLLGIVSVLPKDELAIMAETFVHLTSFKRRVSMEAETVAGPIDVAVISKADGFIWIKRKHYFKPELNHQFFDNYYRRFEDD